MTTKVTSLTDQVARRLQDSIYAGVYPLGTKLPSGKALGQTYGVSQAVIREVTARLRSQGLIDSRQGSGCTVRSRTQVNGFRVLNDAGADHAELSSVFELRLDLEGAAAALAAVRRDAQDIASLEAILAKLEYNLHNLDVGVELDLAFHTAIAAATHNPYYGTLLNYLNLQLRHAVHAARHNALTHEPLSETVQREHIAIYQAIRTRDPDAARAAAMSHLQRAAFHLALDIPGRDQATGKFTEPTRRPLHSQPSDVV